MEVIETPNADKRKPFESKWKLIPEEDRKQMLKEAAETSPLVVAKRYYAEYDFTFNGLYQAIDNELNAESNKRRKEMRKKVVGNGDTGLTETDVELLARFKEGRVGYDEIQKELAFKVFKKILENPDSVKIRDWLQSELIKLKKDETTRQKEALENFINTLFGGFIPSTKCPHCGRSTIIKTETLGEVIHGAELQED